MINKFRAWNRILERYQEFTLQDIERLAGQIQWQNLEIEQSTGKLDANGREIFEGDFYRFEDEYSFGDIRTYMIITWIQEWGLFTPLSEAEYFDYQCGLLPDGDRVGFPLDYPEKIKIIGSRRDHILAHKLQESSTK